MAPTIFANEHLGVVGDGFAGLTSALKLAMQGFRVSVLSRRDDKLKASCSAQGVSTIKGLLEADQELFSLKMLGHQRFLTWLKTVEELSEIEVPCIKGVYENFLSKDLFSFEQHRAYKARFLGAFAVEEVKKNAIDAFEKSFYLQLYPEDFWIDPDVYLRALQLACARTGVCTVEDFDLSSINLNQNGVSLESRSGDKCVWIHYEIIEEMQYA
ncbi:MAG: FAD-dependent oxidoreductase [Proteobacteria bacterium]|nr:FAD-dependent oxidoreductase [Pseudomonadota bacterium]